MPDEPPTEPAESQQPSTTCPSCAAEVAPPGRFCISCGASITSASEPLISTPEGRPDDPDAPVGHADEPDDPPRRAAGEPWTAAGAGRVAARARTRDRSPADLPPASGRGANRSCTSCGAVNARSRELCVVCGLDLDPQDRTAVPPRPALTRDGQVATRAPARRRWMNVGSVVLAVVAVVGAVIAGLAVAELGPFAPREEPLELVTFAAERYPAPPEVLELDGVATLTSAAPADDRVFSPDRLVDTDPRTAWRADAAARPPDTDETIDLLLAAPAWVTGIAISNGDQYDASAYEANGRVQRLELHFDGGLVIGATLLDLGRQRQLIELDEPMLTTAVRLSVVGVLPGVRFEAPALSAIEVRGHPADDQDAALALERADRRPASGALVTSAPSGGRATLPWGRRGQGS